MRHRDLKDGYWGRLAKENPLKIKDFVDNRLTATKLPEDIEVANFVFLLCNNHSLNMAGSNYVFDAGQGRGW